MRANQLRLSFSSFAYVLVQTLRRPGLQGTALAKAQCDTIGLKLFKVATVFRMTVRRIWIAFSECYPFFMLYQNIMRNLKRIPLRI